MENEKERIKEALIIEKEIVHNILHRMNLWQFIFKGGYFRKRYDECSQELIELGD